MKYFGTDGIRDRVEGPLLNLDFVNRVGQAIAVWLKKEFTDKSSFHILIGRDTRESGNQISLQLATGLYSEGIKLFDGGIAPTPAIALCTKELGLDLGIVITASHNPATDNGIKLFLGSGFKLTLEQENQLEAIIDSKLESPIAQKTPPEFLLEAQRHYIALHKKKFKELNLNGLKIAVDCSHGATASTTPELLTLLGASIVSIGDKPNGTNINEGVGSENLALLSETVIESNAHLGIAHDGDGDRVIFCDHEGNTVDGDSVLAIVGSVWAQSGKLNPKVVVTTKMSNLGLDDCLKDQKVEVIRTDIGDRNVLYEMIERKALLGGESSGHFISLCHATTGDGLIMALIILEIIQETGKSLKELASIMSPYPQGKKNLQVKEKVPFDSVPQFSEALATAESKMKGKGRILVRYSGTESKIRLLVEAKEKELVDEVLNFLIDSVNQHLN